MQRPVQSSSSGGYSKSGHKDHQPSGSYASLEFINISSPEAIRDRSKVRIARAHAVTIALARKRSQAAKRGSNFRYLFADDVDHDSKSREDPSVVVLQAPARQIGPSSVDPFETLSVNAQRLTALFHLKSSLHAGEPVFNINDAIHYQSLRSTFGTGLNDGALTAALSLTLSYAANGRKINGECMRSASIAMQQVHHKLSDPVDAVSPATIGTVLLLLGNAYRIGELKSANAHLHGLAILLQQCAQRRINLPTALKRAIYWQDLFSSIFLGTNRIVNYNDFYPRQGLTIRRTGQDPYPPPGFARSSHLLSSGFLNATAGVAALYGTRRLWTASRNSAEDASGLDNVQAYMEGYIHTLRQSTTESMLLCCLIALQLCVYGFWDDVWTSTLIPSELTTQLLYYLRCCQPHDFEDDDLFLWVVYVGKAFAIDASVRNGLDVLWHKRYCKEGEFTFPMWESARRILHDFIWSDVLYSEASGWFQERLGD